MIEQDETIPLRPVLPMVSIYLQVHQKVLERKSIIAYAET
jgi:hypothetical protein